MDDQKKTGNASDHLANERTFLAWIRTSIGIMAFGFVVVKFSLFVKQIALLLGKNNLIQSKGYSALVGIILVAVGAATSLFAYLKYQKTRKQLDNGNYVHSSLLMSVLICFILLVSAFLIFYLVKTT